MKTMIATSRCARSGNSSKSILISTLTFVCLVLFFYQLVPGFTASADSVIASITSHFRPPPPEHEDKCTKDIGGIVCCHLYLAAEPCRDECRKQFVDRETMELTLEYDQCADKCSAVYNETCGTKKEVDDLAGEGLSI